MAPTGSGKTLAYLFPLLHHLYRARSASSGKSKGEAKGAAAGPSAGPRALILSPTRELATQIYDETRRLLRASPEGQQEALRSAKGRDKSKKSAGRKGGIRVALLTGGERVKAVEEKEKGAAEGGAGAKFDVLISTPLRLVQAVEVEGWSLAK